MKPTKILTIEDDQAMREIVFHKLASAGFDVRSAQDGKQGFELFKEFKPDLVILDLMMPEMDGFAVLSAIRALPDKKLAQTPVVVLSNLWSSNDILKVKELKVSEFLVKAYFTPDEILGKIKAILLKSQNSV